MRVGRLVNIHHGRVTNMFSMLYYDDNVHVCLQHANAKPLRKCYVFLCIIVLYKRLLQTLGPY